VKIGEYNELTVHHRTDFGIYLADEDGVQVLLPKRYCADLPQDSISTLNSQLSKLTVFVYHDSEGRLVATTERPFATVGEFALLRVKDVNATGAFLDWGLAAKDLLVPFSEQRVNMKPGRSYIVRVYVDPASQRITASAKLDKFLNHEPPRYYHRQRVDILVTQQTELGYRVIVNNSHRGQIYQNETYQTVNVGDRLQAFVKLVRPDGKVDLTLSKIERIRIEDVADDIVRYLTDHGGTMPFSDKSSPEEILACFNCSKKDFKKALGLLYRNHRITLGPPVALTT